MKAIILVHILVAILLIPVLQAASQPSANDEGAAVLLQDIFELESSNPVRDPQDSKDPGIQALVAAVEKRKPGERALLAFQKEVCAGTSATRVIACGHARMRLLKQWKERADGDYGAYISNVAQIVLDTSNPADMRSAYAEAIRDFLNSSVRRREKPITDSARALAAQTLAALVIETDAELQWQGVLGSLEFGADVKEAEDAVIKSLQSRDSKLRYNAHHLLVAGARAPVALAQGKKGVLNGRGRKEILRLAYDLLSGGSSESDARLVAATAKSLAHLANPDLKGFDDDVRQLIPKLQGLLGDREPLVRYRAFEALHYVSTYAAQATLRDQAKKAAAAYDPRPDEIKALGGPSTFENWKPDER